MISEKTSVKVSLRCTSNTSANNDTFPQLDGEYFGQEEEIFLPKQSGTKRKLSFGEKKTIHQSTQFPNHKNMQWVQLHKRWIL